MLINVPYIWTNYPIGGSFAFNLNILDILKFWLDKCYDWQVLIDSWYQHVEFEPMLLHFVYITTLYILC